MRRRRKAQPSVSFFGRRCSVMRRSCRTLRLRGERPPGQRYPKNPPRPRTPPFGNTGYRSLGCGARVRCSLWTSVSGSDRLEPRSGRVGSPRDWDRWTSRLDKILVELAPLRHLKANLAFLCYSETVYTTTMLGSVDVASAKVAHFPRTLLFVNHGACRRDL